MKSVAEIFGIETLTEDLYTKALTHSSFTKEKGLPYTDCYERLEFLGDAVLKLTVSDDTLADIAKQNGLQELIILSKHEEKLGCRKLDSICACTFEAILGAYYLDNKFDELKKYIEKTFAPYINEVQNHFEKYNAKQILQEYTQGQTQETPVYNVINEQGPQHKKEFPKKQLSKNVFTLRAKNWGLHKMEKIIVSPSLFSADFANLESEIQ